jgi:hypothetical protein
MPHVLVIRGAAELGKRLAEALLGTAGRRARDAVLGTPAEQALASACQAAVLRAVQDTVGADVSDDEIIHVLSLIERLVDVRGLGELRADGAATEAALLADWRRRFVELGYDTQTFPVAVEPMLLRIASCLQDELAREARAPGSPLFGSVALDRLDRLTAEVEQLASAARQYQLARLLPLTEPVESALRERRAVCEAVGRGFVTPDLLLALLEIPGGRAGQCFDTARPGCASSLRAQLRRYAAALEPGESGPFVAFGWTERKDVCRAQVVAWADGASAVTDAHLLLGVLDTGSSTRRQLADQFGGDLSTLRDATAKIAAEPTGAGMTPGRKIWGERR